MLNFNPSVNINLSIRSFIVTTGAYSDVATTDPVESAAYFDPLGFGDEKVISDFIFSS